MTHSNHRNKREIEIEALRLVVDGDSPLSVLVPELRLSLDVARELPIDELIRIVTALASEELLALSCTELDGQSRSMRDGDIERIIDEYERGIRDRDRVEQILDRIDVWVRLTPLGRTAAFRNTILE